VRHSRVSVVSVRSFGRRRCDCSESSAVGVGHFSAWAVGHSVVGSDGEDEKPLAGVRGANVRRLEDDFLDPVASAFKVGADNIVVSDPKVLAHVLEEAPSRADGSNVSDDPRPEVAGVVDPEALSGGAERLARVAANDAIHEAAPRSSVKGFEVSPDRSVR